MPKKKKKKAEHEGKGKKFVPPTKGKGGKGKEKEKTKAAKPKIVPVSSVFVPPSPAINALLTVPSPALESKLYRIRRWGDPVMLALGFDVNQVDTTNFQAIGLYNKLTGFGAVTNFINIERDDIVNLMNMQFEEERNGRRFTPKNKMDWLCSYRGKIYMYGAQSDAWETSPRIRWGTAALGGNFVQVERFENIEAKLPGGTRGVHTMARLVGFRKSDWTRPLDELLAEGLVHRCYCAYKNNQFGDTPKGIVYSPFFSPKDWGFNGKKTLDALYIPAVYLEPKAPSA